MLHWLVSCLIMIVLDDQCSKYVQQHKFSTEFPIMLIKIIEFLKMWNVFIYNTENCVLICQNFKTNELAFRCLKLEVNTSNNLTHHGWHVKREWNEKNTFFPSSRNDWFIENIYIAFRMCTKWILYLYLSHTLLPHVKILIMREKSEWIDMDIWSYILP